MEKILQQALNHKFDHRQRGVPYPSDTEYLRDLQSLLSLHLITLLSFKAFAREVGEDHSGGNYPGVRHSLGEAMARVNNHPAPSPAPEPEIRELLRCARAHIQSRLGAGEPAALRLERLRGICGQSDFTFYCVLCALCSGLDRGFEELFAALHGQTDLRFPTLGAAESLYRVAGECDPALPLTLPQQLEALLFREETERTPPLLRPLALRHSVFAYLTGADTAPGLPSGSAAISPEQGATSPACAPWGPQADLCRAILRDHGAMPSPRLILLNGAGGSGKKDTLRQLGRELQLRFLLLPLHLPATPQEEDALAAELAIRCLLFRDTLCFRLEREEDTALLDALLLRLRPHSPCVFLLADNLRRNLACEGYLVRRIDYPLPDLEAAVGYWRQFAAQCGLEQEAIPWHELAAKYTLTPGRIRAALASAAATMRLESRPLDRGILDQAVLMGNTGRLSEIADPIPVAYTWQDLVLGDHPKALLRDICNRIKYRHVVENKWGFRRRSAYGNGISILLYGPPGTGKTMSAQVLAGELGLPLYRINLAQMISKYIGETAKNLDTVFREARSSNVILFFDEADALFAKRTDVKNSNDRHANSESAYLLQKIEEYAGISILATNLAQNFDEAFRRRIQYMINIPLPSPGQREKLWRGYMGEGAPLAPDVDFPLLAREIELSGSVIKSAALQAAYFAAAEGAEITMAHIVKAVRLELGKLGKGEPHFMGQYK